MQKKNEDKKKKSYILIELLCELNRINNILQNEKNNYYGKMKQHYELERNQKIKENTKIKDELYKLLCQKNDINLQELYQYDKLKIQQINGLINSLFQTQCDNDFKIMQLTVAIKKMDDGIMKSKLIVSNTLEEKEKIKKDIINELENYDVSSIYKNIEFNNIHKKISSILLFSKLHDITIELKQYLIIRTNEYAKKTIEHSFNNIDDSIIKLKSIHSILEQLVHVLDNSNVYNKYLLIKVQLLTNLIYQLLVVLNDKMEDIEKIHVINNIQDIEEKLMANKEFGFLFISKKQLEQSNNLQNLINEVLNLLNDYLKFKPVNNNVKQKSYLLK